MTTEDVLMTEESVEALVVNVDLKPVPRLTFAIRITWCTD